MPDARFRHARPILAASMLLMGACGLIYEYTLGLLGNYLIGSSHDQIFVVIGLMMFAMGVGSALQRRIDRDLVDAFLLIECVLGIVGGLAAIIIYAAFTVSASYQVALYGFALVIGVLIGLEIPLLIRINQDYARSLRANLSEILCMDYLGALIGALAFTYVLVARLSIPRIGIALGLINVLLAVGGLAYFRPLLRRPAALATLCATSLALLGVGMVRVDSWAGLLEQRCYADPIVHRESSPYQHLVLTERGDNTSLYINGRLQFSSRDEAIYHDLLVHPPMALAGRREHVLILGGGDGLALREVLRYPDVREVTLVDIDPAIIRLARSHPDLVRLNGGSLREGRVRILDAEGIDRGTPVTVSAPSKLSELLLDDRSYPIAEVSVVLIDADRFLRGIEGTFDVALLDFPDPSTVEVAKLYSVGFYRALASRLSPGAVVSVQSSSPYHNARAFRCIGRTLEGAGFRVMPYHQNVPSFGEWGWHLAWAGPETVDERRHQVDRLEAMPIETRYLTPDVLRGAFAFGKGWPPDPDPVRANTRLRPELIRYYRRSVD